MTRSVLSDVLSRKGWLLLHVSTYFCTIYILISCIPGLRNYNETGRIVFVIQLPYFSVYNRLLFTPWKAWCGVYNECGYTLLKSQFFQILIMVKFLLPYITSKCVFRTSRTGAKWKHLLAVDGHYTHIQLSQLTATR